MSYPIFSLVVPTRKRPDGLQSLMASLIAQTSKPDRLELILVIDDDDPSYEGLVLGGLRIESVTVPPGLCMGELNMAGYQRSSGRYVMLLNDDVVVRTQGWDDDVLDVFQSVPDGVALVHVNDGIFGDKLCTFPFVSRRYCELAGGICPRVYRRYRIDDHIYNVFNLLSVLGYNRVFYLPEVLFEHQNSVRTSSGAIEYRPDETLHALDTRLFDDLLEERKALALRLARAIDEHRTSVVDRSRADILAPIKDSVSLRKREFIRYWKRESRPSSHTARVTVGMVSADSRSPHAQAAIASVKTFSDNIDLIILDNGRSVDFNHSREMNRLLASCRTDFLVLMDDDVIVEAGWLDGLLRCIGPRIGLVTPLHKAADGRLSYAGVVMRPDYSGHHKHSFAVRKGPLRIQTVCSALMLVDMAKCGHLRLDERYSKYFLDVDYGLQVWEAGFEVVCSPYTIVTHIGGATLKQGSEVSARLYEDQRQRFARIWMDTGRYRALEESWRGVPEIAELLEVPKRLSTLLIPRSDREVLVEEAHQLFDYLRDYPALFDWASEQLWAAAGGLRPRADDPNCWQLAYLLGQIEHSVLVRENVHGLNVVLWNGRYFAIPTGEGAFDPAKFERGEYTRSYKAARLKVLEAMIAADLRYAPAVPNASPRQFDLSGRARTDPVLLLEGYKGFNLVRYDGRVYGILQGDGAFDIERVRRNDYTALYAASTIDDVKRQIDTRPAIVRLFTFMRRPRRPTRRVRRTVDGVAAWVSKVLDAARWRKVDEQREELPVDGRTGEDSGGPLASVWTQQRSQARSHTPEDRQARPSSWRWVESSPPTRVEEYLGFAVYRYEYKYFAVPLVAGEFDYEHWRSNAYGARIVGHTLSEVRELISAQRRAPDSGHSVGARLIFCPFSSERMSVYLKTMDVGPQDELLCSAGARDHWRGFRTLEADREDLAEWARDICQGGGDAVKWLKARGYSVVVIPSSYPDTWRDNAFEAAAASIAPQIEVVYSSGLRRRYVGENLHRLVYNKAYLASMLQVIPELTGKTVLEVGCSDGLVCDMVALLGARKVVGVDVMRTVGCGFIDSGVDYHVMDAADLKFPDETFDVVFSIATLEHVPNPPRVLDEITRVLRRGGYAYVQAGPLYHSPFGHHMFGYFQAEPWIHLRKTKDEIIRHAKEHGIDAAIKRDLGLSAEAYISGMLSRDHLNGLLLAEYGLEEFRSRRDIKVLKYDVSYEGRELISPDIIRELTHFTESQLIEHGFELAFRKL